MMDDRYMICDVCREDIEFDEWDEAVPDEGERGMDTPDSVLEHGICSDKEIHKKCLPRFIELLRGAGI